MTKSEYSELLTYQYRINTNAVNMLEVPSPHLKKG